ncbi:phage tail protein [Gilliamella apicola]|uniref:phage tail protein n=1 Tax=Gilliamella apicola TaxID=1196095 RepID=UPI002FEE398A
MFLEEFLIKIGVDASKAGDIAQVVSKLQTGANQLSNATSDMQNNVNRAIQETNKSTKEAGKSADKTRSKLSKLKLGIAGLIAIGILYGKKLIGAFNSAIEKAKELATNKDALFKISKKELQQANQYQREMNRTGLAIDSVKTKIALNLAPALTNLIGGFRNWLTINKSLIADGITKIIKFVGLAIQVFVNYYKFLNMIITNTIGWKNALIALGVAWAILNRAFLFSPIGIVIGLLTGLLLLIDDLMVYMNGGDSLFGEYWQPFIDGAKSAWQFVKDFWELINALWEGDSEKIKLLSKRLFDFIVNGFKNLINGIKSLLSSVLKNILMFFGVSEKNASKTVDRIGKIFNFINDAITLPFRMAYNGICAVLDWLGLDAGDVVNAIGESFKLIWSLITAPFIAAWNFVNDLFDIWEDDTTSLTDKIGDTLWAIWDFVTSPFKSAWNFVTGLFTGWVNDTDGMTRKFADKFMKIHDSITKPFKMAIDWIQDKFFGFIDSVVDTAKKSLSWTGLFDDEKDADNKTENQTVLVKRQHQIKISPSASASAGVIKNTNSNTTNNSNRNTNISNNNAVTINNTMNVTTPQEGLNYLNNLATGEIQKIADNSTTALGSN